MAQWIQGIALVISLVTSLDVLAVSNTTVIRAGKLLDVENGKMLTNQLIIIRDGKITGVGSQACYP